MQDIKEDKLEYSYAEFISNILETRGRFACGEEYHERHHIVPKCMGGTNDEDNLIDLYAREHFEAHRLLALENPENQGLVWAWWMMAHTNNANQRDYEITAEEYEEAKKCCAEVKSQYRHSELSRQKIKKHHADISGDKNPFFGKSHTEKTKAKMRQYAQNRSDIHLKKISESKKGIPAYNKGIPMSLEQKEKLKASRKDKKAILCIEINVIYESICESARNTHIAKETISRACLGKQKTAGGYHWYYLYDQTRKDGTVIPGAISLGLITEEEALQQLNTTQNN